MNVYNDPCSLTEVFQNPSVPEFPDLNNDLMNQVPLGYLPPAGLESQIPLEENKLISTSAQKPEKESKTRKKSSTNGKPQHKKEEPRLYKCSRCGRTYLSYPALYTHTKMKHMSKGENTTITSGKMRGRPKKIPVLFFNI